MPTETKQRARLGDLLVTHGVITDAQLAKALETQQHGQQNKLLGEILVSLGFATEEQVLTAIAEACGVPFARLTPELLDPEVRSALPEPFILKHLALPLFRVRDVLTVAVAEPSNVFLVEEIAHVAGMNVQIVAAAPGNVYQMLQTSREDADVAAIVQEPRTDELQGAGTLLLMTEDYVSAYGDWPPEKVAHLLIREAVRSRAGAIHLEPDEKILRIRFRIDGALHVVLRPPARLTGGLTDAFVELLGLSGRSLPEPDIRRGARLLMDGRPVQLHMATMRGAYGPRTVLTVVRDDEAVRPLEKLGCDFGLLARYRELIGYTWGLVMVAGPRESGVTSTLYSTLRDLDPIRLNICTFEKAIGYHLSAINQFSPATCGVADPAAALEGLLLQHPDVLMLDGVMDEPVARAAVGLAADGRLVLCQVPAVDAAEAVHRMVQWTSREAVAGALRGVLAQRLVRTVCPHCKTTYEPPAPLRRRYADHLGPVETLTKGRGCPACRLTGFIGRIGLFELVTVEGRVADRVREGSDVAALRQAARDAGCLSLWADAFNKVKAGITSLEEVVEVMAGYPPPPAKGAAAADGP